KSGVEVADKNLFKGKAYVIAEDTGAPPEVHEKLMNVLRLTEANFLTIDIAKHDRCASIISHVPHLTAAALVTLLNDAGNDLDSCLKLVGGGFKDTTRIASSNADMWADICMTNGDAIATHLRDLQNILGNVIAAIENHDRQAVHDYFAKSKARRDKILETITFDPN
ncbi:MAG: prephenate dehydrogenase/arogenate dehydrogenase family protein, partial [Selenomonadaceae bacterium]|nr:prephenate dehydrogenase/arogenate dehydrogenase family protein [Selenomonadaceae bacterium]